MEAGEIFLKRRGVLLLVAFALLYYGQYYRAGLYPAAEGGVEGMVALRLLEGQRPIVDTFLGYNLLWFYPVVALFKIFGPSYTALRVFFFILATITGILSFRLVLKCTHSAKAAFLAGILVLLIPGQMFRNYMAFIVVLNMTTFLPALVLPAPNRMSWILWMGACGISLAIAYLIRVDVGFFLSCLWLALTVAFLIHCDGLLDISRIFAGILLALVLFLLVHLPFYLDASRRGFAPAFVGQYEQWPSVIHSQGKKAFATACSSLSEVLHHRDSHEAPATGAQKGTPLVTPYSSAIVSHEESKTSHPVSQATLARRSLSAPTARDRMLAINLYLPILISGMLGALALGGWLLALYCGEERLRNDSLLLLTCLGCSLTLFPQYFFWRPDMVHLSEFMVPMTVTIIIALFLLGRHWSVRRGMLSIALAFFLFSGAITLLLYYINACQSQSSGGIAAGLNKHIEFHAANGVNVKLTPSEFADASAIYRIITTVSFPGEYLICYPYNPEINFMTGRPSYETNFYVDNVMVSPERFHRETLEKIARYRPVAFVVTNWEVNNTKESQFKNWASETYAFINEHYRLAYGHGNVEVFVRPDRAGLIPLHDH